MIEQIHFLCKNYHYGIIMYVLAHYLALWQFLLQSVWHNDIIPFIYIAPHQKKTCRGDMIISKRQQKVLLNPDGVILFRIFE